MTIKKQNPQHNYGIPPENGTRGTEAVDGENSEAAGERFVSQFKPVTDAPPNSQFYTDAQTYFPVLICSYR